MGTDGVEVRRVNGYSHEIFEACLSVMVQAFARHPLIGGSNDYDLDLIRLDLAGSLATQLWKRAVYIIGAGADISSIMVVRPPTNLATVDADGEDPGLAYRQEYEAKLPTHLKRWNDEVLVPARAASMKAVEEHSSDQDYRITCLATKPSAQRQGHGSALMRFIMDKAAKEKHKVRLASQERCSRSWYESLGFCEIHFSTFLSPRGEVIERWVGLWEATS